jgi:apolipoprotein N-acyltransferase
VPDVRDTRPRAKAAKSGARLWTSISRARSWTLLLPPWRRRVVAALAGTLATAGQAPTHFVPAFVIAICVLIWLLDAAAARARPAASAFAAGWWFGFGYFALGLQWVSSPFSADAALGPLWGAVAVLALAAVLALFWGAGVALASLAWTPDARRIAVFACALGASEWLRGHVLTGFPWLLPGYVWTPGGGVSQVAALGGIYGLSVLTLLCSAAPALLADGARRRIGALIAASAALALTWSWGSYRLAAAESDDAAARPLVRVADAGLSQADKWRRAPNQERRVLERYIAASALDQGDADIVIWPEGAIPVVNFYPLENERFIEELAAAVGDRVLIAGFTRRELHAGEAVHFNSAVVIDAAQTTPRVGAIYDKTHLVPFGEYIPFWQVLGGLNIAPMQRIGAGFEPGRGPLRIDVPGAPVAGVLICYEAIFPGVTPRGEARPAWLINVSNDAWFGGGAGPRQHFEMARYRALETGLPLARAASGGVSAIVDGYGRTIAETGQGAGFAEARLPSALPETPYARWRDLPFALLILVLAAIRFAPIAAMGAQKRAQLP